MSRAAPTGFSNTMGRAMILTMATASANGRVKASTMPMCTISPTNTVRKATRLVTSSCGLSFRAMWIRPAANPSRVVATAPETAAAPPRVTRCRPAVSPTRVPRIGPPRSPARVEPTARELSSAPPASTGVPR